MFWKSWSKTMEFATVKDEVGEGCRKFQETAENIPFWWFSSFWAENKWTMKCALHGYPPYPSPCPHNTGSPTTPRRTHPPLSPKSNNHPYTISLKSSFFPQKMAMSMAEVLAVKKILVGDIGGVSEDCVLDQLTTMWWVLTYCLDISFILECYFIGAQLGVSLIYPCFSRTWFLRFLVCWHVLFVGCFYWLLCSKRLCLLGCWWGQKLCLSPDLLTYLHKPKHSHKHTHAPTQ